MWAVSGAAVSAIIPNSFVAICTPYIFSYIIEKITMTLPDYLNLYYLTSVSYTHLDVYKRQASSLKPAVFQ